ncbi:MAG: hypothetical protein JWR61_4126 [Ferruginibacter sp.]|nr:hypothetical protein [Ferruginibacter sp.]
MGEEAGCQVDEGRSELKLRFDKVAQWYAVKVCDATMFN